MIKSFIDKIEFFLKAGFTENEHGLFLISKVMMYNVVASVAIVVSFLLGFFAFMENFLFLAIADFLFAFSILTLIIYLRRTKKYYIVAISGTIIIGSFYLYLLLTGGANNTASLWLYTYPLVTFSLLDSKKGLIANVIMFFIIITSFIILQDKYEYFTKYSVDYILRFIPSYFVVALYSYLFSTDRTKTFGMLEDKNKKLETIINELEIKKKNLTTLSNELEKRVEERTIELNCAKKDAEASEKIKTEFLAQMSHEIRSPLNVIMNFIELIKYEVEDTISKDVKSGFESIETASRRIIRTIDLILNMTDLQLGSYEITVSEIDVDEMLNRVKNEYQQSANNKGLELELKIVSNNKIVLSDEYALTQIISNLVDNAIKYTSSGYVKIISKDDNNNLIVIVEDSGIGMRREFLPNLFNSFTQEEQGYARSYDGNGLGMALVQKYCNLISTEIEVKSQKGIGSTFSLNIPNLKLL